MTHCGIWKCDWCCAHLHPCWVRPGLQATPPVSHRSHLTRCWWRCITPGAASVPLLPLLGWTGTGWQLTRPALTPSSPQSAPPVAPPPDPSDIIIAAIFVIFVIIIIIIIIMLPISEVSCVTINTILMLQPSIFYNRVCFQYQLIGYLLSCWSGLYKRLKRQQSGKPPDDI